ncbi:hypothetical protein CDL15_Pgr016866 [Punica granatum]|uniref:Uncharacterized protein n=1 Tax=Punica granatum TaxID=22663 RepID=A0A218WY84_PUNGR|nr:hypothetical protein CDL15_Pgr016866 [Punica granatum]
MEVRATLPRPLSTSPSIVTEKQQCSGSEPMVVEKLPLVAVEGKQKIDCDMEIPVNSEGVKQDASYPPS